MRRPSNQSESIAVPLGSDIGTHRPEAGGVFLLRTEFIGTIDTKEQIVCIRSGGGDGGFRLASAPHDEGDAPL